MSRCDHNYPKERWRYGNGESDQYYLICTNCGEEVDNRKEILRVREDPGDE